MPLPTFLVIGAAKCGTGSIYHYLKQHPGVFMSPIKETNYFSYEGQRTRAFTIRTRAEYEALFAGVTTETAIGEASPSYLRSPKAADTIRDTLPGVRLVVSLRHPVDRTYSAWLHTLRNGRGTGRIRDILSPAVVANNRYYPGLLRYFERFPRERIHVILFEAFASRPVETMQRLYGFVGVDTGVEPDTRVVYNRAGRPRSLALTVGLDRLSRMRYRLSPWVPGLRRGTGVLARLRRANTGAAPPLPADVRRELHQHFLEDIQQTAALVGVDLSTWLASDGASPLAARTPV